MFSKAFRFLSLFLLLFIAVAAWTTNTSAKGTSVNNGFQTLRGEEARNFQMPRDMRSVSSQNLAKYGVSVERFHQFHGNAHVFGAQMSVLTNLDGEQIVVGAHFDSIKPANEVKLHAFQARNVAASKTGNNGEFFTELAISPADGRYFYIVDNQQIDARWINWVDAQTGEIINSYNALTTGSGVGVLGDTKDLTGLTSGSYQMVSADGKYATYDAQNRSTLPGTVGTDGDDYWTDGAMVDAQFYAKVTSDYYAQTHGSSWHAITGISQARSSVHVQSNYNNAYWNGQQMAYGDGDGSIFVPLSGDLDVVAHELSHAVTEFTSNLVYQNESGALNEAFSDIMGTSTEYFYGTGNWSIGEDIGIGQYDDGIRNMADPTLFGDPAHYADRYTGTQDNGGVHINSGIANHWYYLLVNGGQNVSRPSGTNVQGIGITDAEQIAYLGFTSLSRNSDFCDARAATIAVAGSRDANVADAWDEVGVTEALCGGGTTDPGGDPGSCTGDQVITGTLSGSGDTDTYTLSGFRGTQIGEIVGPSNADFDLYLYKNSRRGWREVGSSTSADSNELINYSNNKTEDYEWRVVSYSGSGDYSFCFTAQ
ncbi:MAG TPA: M4 family metallopeptidase [Anaerolineae bacterium]|nr:M4 family metallopeptidase [Anaerolineae bacterium]